MRAVANERHPGVLEEYAKLKLQLAGTLRALLPIAEKQGDEIAVSDCRKLLARLAEDRFNLAVVGQFSRGKSSLMNALLGAAKLPTGILPLTSVITSVTYGESEQVRLQREGWSFPQEIRLDELADYVTQGRNPGNEKRVTLAEIRLPHEMLRLGVHFIDTPGIASAIRANTQTTRQFLPEIDAAILVTSFESPFGEAEMEFLREVREHVRTVFIVVNKHDLVASADREPILEAIREDLIASFGSSFDLFSISARDALSAKQRGSRQDLETSGLPALESALTSFLRTRKVLDLLLRAADRTESIARRQAISMRISARACAPEEAQALDHRLQELLTGVQQERDVITGRVLHRIRLAFPDECERTVPLWSPEIQATLVLEWRHWFLQGGDRTGDGFAEYLRHLSGELFAGYVSRHRETIEGIFSRITGAELPAVERLVNKIALIPSQVLAESDEKNSPLFSPLESAPLTFRGIDVAVDSFELPWWYDLMPKGWPRELACKYWEKRMPLFVTLYQESAQAALQTAADDWAAVIGRQLDARIEKARSHMGRLLHAPKAARSFEVGGIIEGLQAFREAVQQMGSNQPGAPMMSGDPEHGRKTLRRCVICSGLERTLWDFMAHAQYELSVNEREKHQHAARSGFCPLHTWQYETVSSPQGVCAAYPAVLKRCAQELRESAADSASTAELEKSLRSILPRTSSCAACALLASEESVLAREIARRVSKDNAESSSLCAWHLRSVLATGPDAAAARKLVLDEARAFEDLAEEMETYVLKHTAVRHHLTTRAENGAAVAGLALLAGSQRLCGPWRIE